ncbi:MAG: Crp/Fnr family transcriptional regulator [Gaiellaceae bacterium]
MAEPTSELVFLADRSEADWTRLLDHTETLRFSAGDVVIRAGHRDRSLYIVTSGELEVLLPGSAGEERHFTTIGSRSVTGEMAFIDGRPRSATIRARSDGELARLSFEQYEVLAARYPELGRAIVLDVARILAARLRETNEALERTGW